MTGDFGDERHLVETETEAGQNILLRIDDSNRTIVIVRVDHRAHAYRT